MPTSRAAVRGLAVFADGAQAAFAAGAVAELARAGMRWRRGAGAGLGAQIAALALLGEADEAERRWKREAELGCPLFESRLAAVQRRLGEEPGVLALADGWRLEGWLDPAGLDEHLAPEAADLPRRLATKNASCVVAVANLGDGGLEWTRLEGAASAAAAVLRAAASFPSGWGAARSGSDTGGTVRWGGVGLLAALGPPWSNALAPWDVVCGFPVPAVARPALGSSLLELAQRRDECLAAATLGRWNTGEDAPRLRVVAPAPAAYASFSARDTADLGVEYPLPFERNSELLSAILRFGSFAAARALGAGAS